MVKIRLLKSLDRLFGTVLIHLIRKPEVKPLPQPKSILFIRPGGIGDAVHLLPAIAALKEKYPDASITILAEKRNSAIFSLCRAVDRTFCYDSLRELAGALRSTYDIVIDTEQWHRLSAIIARMTRAPVLIGYATNQRKRMFTHTVSYSHETYEKSSFFSLLEPLGITDSLGSSGPFLTVPERAVDAAVDMIAAYSDRPFVTLFPGASIPERRWGTENFRELAMRLHSGGVAVVVVGGRGDAEAGEKIAAGGIGLNLAGCTSLAETAAVLSKSRVLVSGDSGVLHIAEALDVPTVSLFGPGIENKWAPRGVHHIVLNRHLDCSPCTKFGYTPRCKNGARCLSDIGIDEVANAVLDLLKSVPWEKNRRSEQIP